jgi:hypothetical protein
LKVPTLGEGARERAGVVATLVLDTTIVVTALLSRWAILKIISVLSPVSERTFVVVWLERISDVGIVLTGLVFTAFDFLKVIVRSWKSFLRTARGESA